MKVSEIKVFFLLLAVVTIYVCVLVSFWSQLLIAEDFECTNRMDCFALSSTPGHLIQQSPLGNNCSQFEDAGYTIECYKLAFNYINAIGNAGSVLIIGAFFMNSQSGVIYAMFHLKEKKRTLGLILLWVYVISGMLICFALPLFLLAPVVDAALLSTRYSKIQFSAYYLTFAFAYLATGPLLVFLNWPPWKLEDLYIHDEEPAVAMSDICKNNKDEVAD